MTDRFHAVPMAIWARRYIDTFKLALVNIEPGEKAPKGLGWNKPGGYITDAQAAEAFWTANPMHNLGVVLGPSRVCSLDVDDVQWTRHVLYELLGLDLDAMALVYPTVVGNPARFRILFQLPDGIDLTRHSLAWPNENDPDGSIFKGLIEKAKAAKEAGDLDGEAAARAEAEPYKRFTVFELRAGLVQDVLPPSIHPGTGKPYTWRTPPSADGLPVLTTDLLAIWQNWDIFKRDAEAACPWAPKAEKVKPKSRKSPTQVTGNRPSVIDEFNRSHDVEELLRTHGYIKRGNKWLYPQSSTGLPGITITDGKLYSHHGADPLANGHQNDAFEVFCLLEHGGDQAKAVKDAARMLGMQQSSRPSPTDLPPTPSEDASGQGESMPASAAAPAPEGVGGSEWTPDRIFQRFALIEGKTAVFDMFKRVIIKKPAFELLVTKALAKDWFESAQKKVIADDMAERQASKAKAEAKFKQVSGEGMSPTERYVYIDGTKDSWDIKCRRRVPEGAMRMALGDAYAMWLNSPDRRTVDMEHIVFDPRMTKDPEVYINTFEGLPLVPINEPNKCRTLRSLFSFLCNHDEAATDWLIKWLAYPLQNIGAKMDTAVLLHSTMEGSGKSLLLSDIMGAVYGEYAATVGQSQLESSWTVWQSNKLYGVFEEVVSRDQRYNQVGKIKHMVTGKTVRMESKFVNGWEEANHMNAVFLSNEIMPWPIGENDRRMLVVWPKETLGPDEQERVKYELANEGIPALYDYLLSYDLGDFDQRTRPPNTEARQRLVDLSMASWQTFLREWRNGLLGAPFSVCVSSDLYALFLEWCHRNKEHTLSHTKFSGFISTEVDKIQGKPWMDGSRRSFGTFFFPWSGIDAAPSPPPSLTAAGLGAAVVTWREAAKAGGWSVGSWEHVKFGQRQDSAA